MDESSKNPPRQCPSCGVQARKLFICRFYTDAPCDYGLDPGCLSGEFYEWLDDDGIYHVACKHGHQNVKRVY